MVSTADMFIAEDVEEEEEVDVDLPGLDGGDVGSSRLFVVLIWKDNGKVDEQLRGGKSTE